MTEQQSSAGSAAVLRLGCWTSQDGTAAGIMRLMVEVDHAERATLDDAVLELSAASQANATLRKTVSLAGGHQSFWIGVHTHLLPNGENHIAGTLWSAQGAVIASARTTFHVANAGVLAATVTAKLRRDGVPLMFDGPCATSHYDYTDRALQPWFDRDDAAVTIQRLHAAGEVTDAQARALAGFVDDGYLILPEAIDLALVDRVNAEIDDAVAKGYQGYKWGTSQRLEHLHDHYPAIRQLWMHPGVLHMLDTIFGYPARVCQSLTYVFGSQQDAHQDTIHLTSYPAGYMCGVWVALQDVARDSGELVIYPGSHRFPRVYMDGVGCAKVKAGDWTGFGATVVPEWRRLLAESGIQPVTYAPRSGTVLIWHENLMHGGSRRVDPSLTRRSFVTHNFAEGCLVFYDSTGEPGMVAPRAAGASMV